MTISTYYASPHQRRAARLLYSALAFIRLLIAGLCLYWVYSTTEPRMGGASLWIAYCTLTYAIAAVVQGIALGIRPQQTIARYTSLMDGVWTAALLWLIPNQPWVGMMIPLTLWLAACAGWSYFALFIQAALLCGVAAATAQYQGILLSTHIELLPHGIAACASLLTLLIPLYVQTESYRLNTTPSLKHQSDLPDQQVLEDALRYLAPMHQRLSSPLSLMLIQLPQAKSQRQHTRAALIDFLQERIRQSDLLVHIGSRHIALLLCDTDESGSSQLAQYIQQYRYTPPLSENIHLDIAICKLPATQFAVAPILDRMLNSLSHAEKHQVTRIIFVSPS